MSRSEQNYIRTSNGEKVKLNRYDFSSEGAAFNQDEALRSLETARQILDLEGVGWGLTFGTLLGAVRESDFIAHDHDVDVAISCGDTKKFIDSLPRFTEAGFVLIRFERTIVSLLRNGIYIDFYFCRRTLFGYRMGVKNMQSEFMRFNEKTSIRGVDFPCHGKKLHVLETFYGPNWKVPIKNSYATHDQVLWKRIATIFFPTLAKRLWRIRNQHFLRRFR